jgi:ubiquinone/menaquinone biosynthesis C-methylase UbiE
VVQLVCPRCRASLEAGIEAVVCHSCGAEYPTVDGVPVLVTALSTQHEHQRNYFDAEFSTFETYRVDNWRRSFNDRIFSSLRLDSGSGPYLDVGVGGSGATVIEAARIGVESTGCDLSVTGVISAARFARAERVSDLTTFVVCAAEALPFPDTSVGAASAVAVLEHLDDDEPAVRELARVVRPGGRVWVTVPHAYRLMPPFVWPAYFVHDRRIGHRRHYETSRLQALFSRHGLELIEAQYTGHPIKIVQYVTTVLAERVRVDSSRLWWLLERADLRAVGRQFWAVQLSAVFVRS